MMRGRRIAVAAGVLAAATVGGAILIEFDRIAEGWWIRKLRSPDEAVRHHAAERLGELRSLRAVPAILRAIGRDPGELAIEQGRFEMTPDGEYDSWTVLRLTPLAFGLHRIGPPAGPLLEDALRRGEGFGDLRNDK